MSLDESIVLYRLSDYERRGWISQIDSAQYRSVMNQRRGDAVTLRQISTRLDELALKGTSSGSGALVPVPGATTDNTAGADDINNMTSPTYTATSSSSTTATSAASSADSGATSASLASTADPNVASEDYGDEDDEEDVAVVGSALTKKGGGTKDDDDKNKSKKETSSSGPSPYLRSLQCISNLANDALINSGGSKMLTTGNHSNSSKVRSKGRQHHPNQQHHHVTWKDDDNGNNTKKKGGDALVEASSSSTIMEPSQLWTQSNRSLNPSLLQELFVEMCFYARLGFVQPPCCLKCTYRTAHDSNSNNDCQQYVVWRKNASALLHPSTLATNIVLVPCQSAQQLLDGKVVSQHYWDAAAKRLKVVTSAPP